MLPVFNASSVFSLIVNYKASDVKLMFDSEEQFKYKEQELEDTLRMNDRFSARYFSLLERFADLPACDELIMAQLKDEFPPEFLDSLEVWDDKITPDIPDDFDDKAIKDFPSWEEQKPDDLPPEMKLLRQLDMRGRRIANTLYQSAFDWCNIQVIMFATAYRADSMRILFFIGRALGAFNASMDALSSHEICSTVVLCKRAQFYANCAIRLLMSLGNKDEESLKKLMVNRGKQLEFVVNEVDAQINDSRKLARQEGHF